MLTRGPVRPDGSLTPTLRVAVVTETYPPEVNGVAMTLDRLVGALRQRGHLVQLVRPRQSNNQKPQFNDSLEEVFAPGIPIPGYRGLRFGVPITNTLWKLWNQAAPDVIHIATEGPLGWSAMAAARRNLLPVATGFHTNFHMYSRHYGFGFLGRPIASYLRQFHRKALATMVPSESLCRELAAQGYENVRVVARGVDTRLFNPDRRNQELRRSWGAGEADPVAIYVGRLAPEKNLPLVAMAYECMRQRNPAAKLVWVGDGPAREALSRQHPHNIFAGTRTGKDLAEHYASADVFLFSSMTETFGNVVLEAMASGLAVVTFNYAAGRQHIENSISGLLSPFGDNQRFIRDCASLVNDPLRARSLGRAARHAALNADWEAVFDQYERVLHNVIEKSRMRLQPAT